MQAAFEKALKPLITVLQTGDEPGRELCALALHQLAVSQTACQKITDGGAIKPLVQLLSKEATGGKGAAADALASLASYPDPRQHILTAGAIQPLIRCLGAEHGFGACQWPAARALARLAETDARIRRRVYAEGALGLLVRLLRGTGEEEGAAALGQPEDIAEFLAADGSLARVVGHLVDDPYPHQLLAGLVWERLAQLLAVRGLLLGPETLPAVVQGLRGRPSTLTAALARGMGSLAEAGEDAVAELCDRGVIPPLVRLLEGEPPSGKHAAVSALTQLMAHSGVSLWEGMADEGVLKPLFSLLQTGSEEAKEAAAILCEKLAREGNQAQDRMVDAGCLPALVGLIESGAPRKGLRYAALIWESMAQRKSLAAAIAEQVGYIFT